MPIAPPFGSSASWFFAGEPFKPQEAFPCPRARAGLGFSKHRGIHIRSKLFQQFSCLRDKSHLFACRHAAGPESFPLFCFTRFIISCSSNGVAPTLPDYLHNIATIIANVPSEGFRIVSNTKKSMIIWIKSPFSLSAPIHVIERLMVIILWALVPTCRVFRPFGTPFASPAGVVIKLISSSLSDCSTGGDGSALIARATSGASSSAINVRLSEFLIPASCGSLNPASCPPLSESKTVKSLQCDSPRRRQQ